jgi:hypothetical protein
MATDENEFIIIDIIDTIDTIGTIGGDRGCHALG